MNFINEVIIHHCYCSQDATGDYTSSFKIDFILTTPCTVEIFGIVYVIDRIRMQDAFYDETELVFANSLSDYKGLQIPKYLLRSLYRKLCKEQNNGILKGWCFEERISDFYKEVKN